MLFSRVYLIILVCVLVLAVSTLQTALSEYLQEPQFIEVLSDNSWIVAGYTTAASIKIGNYMFNNSNSGTADAYVARYIPSTQTVDWLVPIFGENYQTISYLAISEKDESIVVAGSFSKECKIGKVNLTRTYDSDVSRTNCFVTLISKLGVVSYAKKTEASSGSVSNNRLLVSKFDNTVFILVAASGPAEITVDTQTVTLKAKYSSNAAWCVISLSSAGAILWTKPAAAFSLTISGGDSQNVIALSPDGKDLYFSMGFSATTSAPLTIAGTGYTQLSGVFIMKVAKDKTTTLKFIEPTTGGSSFNLNNMYVRTEGVFIGGYSQAAPYKIDTVTINQAGSFIAKFTLALALSTQFTIDGLSTINAFISNNYIYQVSPFSSNITVGTTVVPKIGTISNVVIIALTTNLKVQWTKGIQGSFSRMNYDSSGLLLLNSFSSNITVEGTPFEKLTQNSYNSYLVKFAATTGSTQWLNRFTGKSSSNNLLSILVDTRNHTILMGRSEDSISMGNQSIVDIKSHFITELSESGSFISTKTVTLFSSSSTISMKLEGGNLFIVYSSASAVTLIGRRNFTASGILLFSNGTTLCKSFVPSCKTCYDENYCENSCYDIPAELNTTCSGHGQCKGVNNCNCVSDFYSSDCSKKYILCNGVRQDNITYVCSGHGVCLNNGSCNCTRGWQGSACGDIIVADSPLISSDLTDLSSEIPDISSSIPLFESSIVPVGTSATIVSSHITEYSSVISSFDEFRSSVIDSGSIDSSRDFITSSVGTSASIVSSDIPEYSSGISSSGGSSFIDSESIDSSRDSITSSVGTSSVGSAEFSSHYPLESSEAKESSSASISSDIPSNDLSTIKSSESSALSSHSALISSLSLDVTESKPSMSSDVYTTGTIVSSEVTVSSKDRSSSISISSDIPSNDLSTIKSSESCDLSSHSVLISSLQTSFQTFSSNQVSSEVSSNIPVVSGIPFESSFLVVSSDTLEHTIHISMHILLHFLIVTMYLDVQYHCSCMYLLILY
jgi:hypothetical protein